MQSETQNRSSGRARRLAWLAGLIVAFFGTYVGLQVLAALLNLSMIGAAALGQGGILAVTVAFLLLDGDGFRGVGLFGRWKGYDLGVIVGIIALHLVGSTITAQLMNHFTPAAMEKSVAAQLLRGFGAFDTGTFLWIALGLALQSGIGEELLFRGYLITRLERLNIGAWPCILLSGLIFGLIHWPGYGFLAALSKGIWFGIPTAAFFWYRRSLGQLIVAHALMNFMGFAMAHLIARYLPTLPI